jgi:hypothetical protein
MEERSRYSTPPTPQELDISPPKIHKYSSPPPQNERPKHVYSTIPTSNSATAKQEHAYSSPPMSKGTMNRTYSSPSTNLTDSSSMDSSDASSVQTSAYDYSTPWMPVFSEEDIRISKEIVGSGYNADVVKADVVSPRW